MLTDYLLFILPAIAVVAVALLYCHFLLHIITGGEDDFDTATSARKTKGGSMMYLKCPVCGFSFGVVFPDDITEKERVEIMECPCGAMCEETGKHRHRSRVWSLNLTGGIRRDPHHPERRTAVA